MPGNGPGDLSAAQKHELDRQLEGQLKAVLRPADFTGSNLEEAFELVCKMAATLSV